ncbi:pseudouridine-5'-phosphate glycosidase [Thalassospira sp. GO-4]|jgi:pseudouridine-5'-phosphate glycosidase|uniref:pseudouridine-5'-phosphate glycosidase n=1 Tax=Thalassospira TaxID=168934 RepID=UPI0020259779|nr:pseudouridine-5'-phosphate glycosidase [Thalassospira sp. GO-4]URK17743.1 pseudouridine-5'-phosphate glycosidase [Thalassospira sp. GO-4]|eukprot:TRINITY_DN1805_c0_g1_i1.p1 TRINITY_DN1805_c0_g1~~TRINITY_DN1805_c0_g1_i1.p1  ORF type:complete len:303 (+),score=83.38 TRINITY_DN1805_c0_g1_i1:514-1422(+)
MSDYIDIAPEVAEALASGKPVVALESTIISHGMPYPQNLETAQAVEQDVRDNGAIPATIAVIGGRCKIGLSPEELEYFAKGTDILKLSRRDIPYCIAKKRDGATTVSATMILAEKAGIRVFATGGIGGVHRDLAGNFDVSADLTELGKTSVAVVCAGAKAILDIPKTLEHLETLGVPVIAYGTDEFPAFYSVESGHKAPLRLDSPEDLAAFLKSKWEFGLEGGAVIGNPPEADKALAREAIEGAIDDALAEAQEKGIHGRDVTPFLLARVTQLTEGKSLEANIALVRNNARLGAKIAVAMAG